MPNEIILAILEELPKKALVAMAGICHHIRPLIVFVYLEHLGVISSESGFQELQLCENVPAIVFLLLTSVHLQGDINFVCDVYFLLDNIQALQEFSVRTLITSVCLQFHSHEPAVLHAPQTTCVLGTFLSSLSTKCRVIAMETSNFSSFPPCQVSQSAGHLDGTTYSTDIRMLMSNAIIIALTDDLCETPSLAKIRSLLLEGPLVFDFGLTCMSMKRNRSNSILSQVNFPILQCLQLSTAIIPQLPAEFFHRHTSLYLLALFGQLVGQSQHYQPRSLRSSSRTIELPRLAVLTFSDRFLPWVSVFSCPNLRTVAISPSMYIQRGQLVDSWSGLHDCFNAVIHRGMLGKSMTLAMPDGGATIEHEAMREFSELRKGECPVLTTSKLTIRLHDLSNESLKLVTHWATMLVHLQKLELLVHPNPAAYSDPSDAEVQRFLIAMHQTLREFDMSTKLGPGDTNMDYGQEFEGCEIRVLELS